jgi:hypothetical protein
MVGSSCFGDTACKPQWGIRFDPAKMNDQGTNGSTVQAGLRQPGLHRTPIRALTS